MSSFAVAPPEVRDVTLSVFAGRKTDIAPSDCPEGISPDTEDGIYLPGEWISRPGLGRLYGQGVLTAGTSVLYEKTYVQPNNDPLTLILTSDGKLWAEDVDSAPGVPIASGTVTPGLYAQSITEFGREYIAFSDLLHGQGVPLQFDGSNLDRVTQDGPGAVVGAADYNVSFAIAASPGGLAQPGVHVVSAARQVGNLCSLTVTSSLATDSARVGDLVLVAAVVPAGYNGTFPIASIQRIGVVSIISYVNTVSGLASAGVGGSVKTAAAIVTGASAFAGTEFTIGQKVKIAGAGVAGYNGTWPVVGFSGANWIVYLGVFGLAASGNGTIDDAGTVDLGTHQLVCFFITRQGAFTGVSPIGNWTAAGGKRVLISGLPIGPSNVVARGLGFTGAGGGNFFILPATITLPQSSGPPIIVASTIVPDNTSSSAVLDFTDNALFAGVPIDVVGNDLFDQCVLGPVLGFFAFASRLSCWGDYNKLQNLRAMGFCGGYAAGDLTSPYGWNAIGNSGGTLVNGGSWAGGMSWQITGDGTNNQRGLLTQSAYQDSIGVSIISPNTRYSVRFWAKAGAAGLVGTVFITLTSASAVFTSTAQISIANLSTAGGLTAVLPFSAQMPAVIPSDLLLSVYEVGLANGSTVQLGELELIFTENPYRDRFSRWSYVNNPEAFALTTGNLGATDDDSPVRCLALQRQAAILETAEGIHDFVDNDFEPNQWKVNEITRAFGALSLRAGDPGMFGTGDAAVDWAPIAAKNGVYILAGTEYYKISQEISRPPDRPQSVDPRKCWDDITWAAQHTIVTKNDPALRRLYIAAPINGATKPNVLFVLDYREMDTAAQIAGAAPVHITLQGKMKSSDLTRKWSVWNLSADSLEILTRPANDRQLCVGGGSRNGAAHGNIYTLNPLKLSDDDYGAMAPYYTTYAFTDHDQEEALGLGSGLHLYRKVSGFITGVGMVTITPIVNSLYNFLAPLSPRILTADTNQSNFLASDLEWNPVGLRGQRVFFRISVQPNPGSTDVQLRLQKFIVGMMKDPVLQFRQSGV